MTTADKVIQALQSYKLEDKGNGNYRCRSPFRTDSDSPSFSLKVDSNGEYGTWYDFVTETSGSLYDLADHLGIDTPKGRDVTQVDSTKRDYESITDYEIAHGLPRGTLKKIGWQQIVHQGRIALSFPTASGTRYRFLTGDGNRYTSPKGYKACWYGLDNKLKERLADTGALVIANGEIGTITARYYGLAACATTGGERDIPDNLIAQFKNFFSGMNFEILIPADCDDKGREVALKRQATLASAGYRVKVVDLGLSEHGDIGDFCMLYSDDSNITAILKDLPTLSVADAPFDPTIALENIRSRRTWSIMPAKDLQKLPPIKWLEKPIITNRGTTVLYGASGSGKSFYILDKALHIAQKHKVLYIAAEGEYGYRDRVAAWTKHYGMDEGQLFMCTGAVNFSDDTQLSEFVHELKNVVGDVSLIIVDTLARSMGGADENSTRDMNKFVETCDVIKHFFECAMVIVHHTNKGGVTERGSGALRGAADVMINLTDEDDLTLVECSKTKDNEPFDSYYFKLQTVDIGRVDEDGEPVTPAVAVLSERVPQDDNSPLTNKQRKVLNTLAMEVFAYGATSGELSDAIPEIPDRTMYRVLDRLTALKYIEQSGKRQPYTITDEGLIKIGELPRNATTATSAKTNDTSIFKNYDSTLSHSGGSGISGSMAVTSNESNSKLGQKALIDVPVVPKSHYEGGY